MSHKQGYTQDSDEEDEDDLYGKIIAMELRKIQDRRTKALVKCKIQSVLFEAQFSTSPNDWSYWLNCCHEGQDAIYKNIIS